MRTHTLLLAALALGFAPAPPPRSDRSEADLKNMQGAWVLVTSTVDGKPASECERRLVIQGNRMKCLDDEGTYELALTLDATKSPRRFVIKGVRGAAVGSVERGIYSLEGDTLKFCSYRGGVTRPESFDASK
jgi:uncharacterized protein (TIGR03067 family)